VEVVAFTMRWTSFVQVVGGYRNLMITEENYFLNTLNVENLLYGRNLCKMDKDRKMKRGIKAACHGA